MPTTSYTGLAPTETPTPTATPSVVPQDAPDESSKASSTLPLAIGIVIGLLLVITAIVVVCFITVKRKKKQTHSDENNEGTYVHIRTYSCTICFEYVLPHIHAMM